MRVRRVLVSGWVDLRPPQVVPPARAASVRQVRQVRLAPEVRVSGPVFLRREVLPEPLVQEQMRPPFRGQGSCHQQPACRPL